MKNITLIWILLAMCSCSASTATNDPDSNPNESKCLNVAASWTTSLTTSITDANLSSDLLPLVLSVTNSRNINAYLISEDDAIPATDDARWVTADSTTALNLNLDYHLQSQGNKILTAWIKDECGAITSTTSLQKIWDTEAPAGTLKINDGDKLTLPQNNVVLLNLSATDSTSIVAYAYTLTNTPPLESDWISIEATQQLNRTTDTIGLPALLQGAKIVYAWLKDGLGHVTQLSDDIEILNSQSLTSDWGNGYDIGQYSSIAVDSNNQPFISTYFRRLGDANYAVMAFKDENTLLGFTLEDIDQSADTGAGTSIAIDSEDRIHIAYKDSTHNTLKYATLDLRNPGNYTFDTETIEAGGFGPSIAVDSQGKIHIVHVKNAKIQYSTNKTGSWVTEPILDPDNFYTISTSIVLDSEDKIYTAVSGGGGLDYATQENGIWHDEEIIHNLHGGSQLILLHDETPEICFNSEDFTQILCATQINGQWDIAAIAQGSYNWMSMVQDSQGSIHMVYETMFSNDLVYLSNYSGTWKTMTLDSTGNVGDFCDIAIDHHDRIHISYYDRTNTDLKYATTSDNP